MFSVTKISNKSNLVFKQNGYILLATQKNKADLMRNFLLLLSLFGITGGGLYYLLQTDIDRPPQLAFTALVERLRPVASALQAEFRETNRLTARQLPPEQLDFQSLLVESMGPSFSLQYQIVIEPQRIRVLLRAEDPRLDGKWFSLDPKLTDQKIIWRCLGGDLLLRYRTRACRVGTGLVFGES